MALGDSYATLAELKNRLGITDATDDARLTASLAVASRGIDKVCHRQFNDAGSASARVFTPNRCDLATVDDFSTTTGLVIATDDADSGSYTTTWAAGDYQLEPLNGVVDGEPGWPFWRIRSLGVKTFPVSVFGRATLQVTARWGWAAVPVGAHEACLIAAEEIFKLSDAPFGVANFGEFGAVRVRANPIAMGMIGPYVLDPVLVA